MRPPPPPFFSAEDAASAIHRLRLLVSPHLRQRRTPCVSFSAADAPCTSLLAPDAPFVFLSAPVLGTSKHISKSRLSHIEPNPNQTRNDAIPQRVPFGRHFFEGTKIACGTLVLHFDHQILPISSQAYIFLRHFTGASIFGLLFSYLPRVGVGCPFFLLNTL